MRKKLTDEEKKVRFGLSLDPDLLKILKEYTTEKDIKISRFIESVVREHFEKKNIKNNDYDLPNG